MTDSTSHEADARRRDIEKRSEIMARGLTSGLDKNDVYTLTLIDRALGFPPTAAGVGEYDKYSHKIDMFRAYLKKLGSPAHLGPMCDEIAAANSRFDRRALWGGATYAIKEKMLANVSGFGNDRIVALPEWQLSSRKK